MLLVVRLTTRQTTETKDDRPTTSLLSIQSLPPRDPNIEGRLRIDTCMRGRKAGGGKQKRIYKSRIVPLDASAAPGVTESTPACILLFNLFADTPWNQTSHSLSLNEPLMLRL
ncbi:hypothetical protein Pcinc_040907 [Petrolisthes cinctipes]|uniref:Uncharacterized protein n=1 Tax=Petrolisthes cinctipes TaxID=88211 RepID=A0AAE1BLZ1_PETCI|nr:hypothetical protein Pcinc_040907 [Petrolisthes cinctipes]